MWSEQSSVRVSGRSPAVHTSESRCGHARSALGAVTPGVHMIRVLLCITVYNGRAFVPAALASATRLDTSNCDLAVLILDDCSPEQGWSAELSALCADLGFRYYRSPRNLGIPRNVNLGLITAAEENFDFVIISNSDVLFPRNLLTQMVRAAEKPNIGSVTAWSNNVSIYSIPNTDPGKYLTDQNRVDWISEQLAQLYPDTAVDIPAGISFCIIIPVPALRNIGLMDPVFGRGYCEETDWTLRSQRLRYRIALAPGVFVYHTGNGSTIDAGLLQPGQTYVPDNQAIVDLRYPQFRFQVRGFLGSGNLMQLHFDALYRIISTAGKQFGYYFERSTGTVDYSVQSDRVLCTLDPDDPAKLRLTYCGFELAIDATNNEPSAYLDSIFEGAHRSNGVNDTAKPMFHPDPPPESNGRLNYPGGI